MTTDLHSPSISAERKTIASILSDKQNIKVPPYQRSFSWTKTEITELWEDLREVIYEDKDVYFLGSLVFISKHEKYYEVVDGQQRLATISLYLAVIRDGFKEVNDLERSKHIEINYLCSKNLETLESYPRISLNETDNDLFKKLIESSLSINEIKSILERGDVPESNKLLAESYLNIYEVIKGKSSNFTDKTYLAKLVSVLTEKITCIQIVTISEDAAYILFETLNDRGIDLTLSDLLKNYLFSKSGTRIDEVKSKWIEIVALTGQESMKTFIRHDWISKYGKIREKDLYSRIKRDIDSNPKAIDYVAELQKSANIYDALQNPDNEIWNEYGEKCKSRLREIALLGTVQCFPLILSAYSNRPRDLIKILSWIISLTIRYTIICAKSTGNLETAYANACSQIRDPNINLNEIKATLQTVFPSDDEFTGNFNGKTLSSSKIIKYLFIAMERHLSRDDSQVPNPETLTIEHILPRKPSSEWPGRLRDENFLKEHVNRIGNMTILSESINQRAGSKLFVEKKNIYKKSCFKITKLIKKYNNWDDNSIQERQKELAKLAAQVWII